MMISRYELSDTQCQPCDAFKPMEENSHIPGGFEVHECFRGCEKTVAFCGNCHRDHHEGGYNNCVILPTSCKHPACTAKAGAK